MTLPPSLLDQLADSAEVKRLEALTERERTAVTAVRRADMDARLAAGKDREAAQHAALEGRPLPAPTEQETKAKAAAARRELAVCREALPAAIDAAAEAARPLAADQARELRAQARKAEQDAERLLGRAAERAADASRLEGEAAWWARLEQAANARQAGPFRPGGHDSPLERALRIAGEELAAAREQAAERAERLERERAFEAEQERRASERQAAEAAAATPAA